MSLAASCLGEERREWALAMQGEFEAAAERGEALAFAAGCLLAALREMPKFEQGRLAIASHALAIGLLIPMGFVQLSWAAGFPNLLTGPDGPYRMLSGAGAHGLFLADAQLSALPVFLVVWLLLGIGHIRLAWLLVEREWERVIGIGLAIAATGVTLFIFAELLSFDVASLFPQAAMLGVEAAFVLVVARWQARMFPKDRTICPIGLSR